MVILIMILDKLVGKYGIGWIDYVENWLIGIKLWEIYECLVVMVFLVVYKDIEDIILEWLLVYFKLVIEK